MQCTKADLVSGLKTGEADERRKRLFGRRALVVRQIAGSAVLLFSATQLQRLLNAAVFGSQGFRVDHRLTMRFAPEQAGYTAQQSDQFYKMLTEKSRNMPGVKSAALGSWIPMTADIEVETIAPERYVFPAGQESACLYEHRRRRLLRNLRDSHRCRAHIFSRRS